MLPEKLRTSGTKYKGVPIGCPLGNISKSRSFGQVDKKSILGLKKIRKEADCACVICVCAYIENHCPSCPLVLKIDWFIGTAGDRKCGKI